MLDILIEWDISLYLYFHWTSGFMGYRRSILEKMSLDSFISTHYAFQIEMKYRFLKSDIAVCEFPIHFYPRRNGMSKLSFRVVIEAIYTLLRLAYRNE